MHITLPKELVLRIEERIRSIIADESASNARIREVVQRTNALPLALDSGGGFSLTSTGDIIGFLWDNSDVSTEEDARLINIALFQGSRKYHELEVILPSRSSGAVECPYCNGTGFPTDARDSGITNIVCYCGGLGWIPAGDSRAEFSG